MQGREAGLLRLAQIQSPEVLIIGGGINGIGVLHDLALQGIPALLVERGDFCSGTSAAPSRLIHGGLRYLETGEFSLVRESLVERNRLLLNAPHAVKPIRVWVPLRGVMAGVFDAVGRLLRLKRNPGPKGALVVKLGLVLYDLLGRTLQTMPRHRFIGSDEREKRLTGLARDVRAVAEYFDAKVTMPERLGLELIADAEATCPETLALPYVEVFGSSGDVVRLRDVMGGHEYQIRPRLVVNCTGAWLDRVDARLDIRQRLVGGTKGSHLVLRHPALAAQLGDVMLYFETDDHRICLVYALDDRHVLLGTTDMPTDEPEDPVCTQAEVDYLYAAVKEFMPDLSLSNDQIVFSYAGVRPLPLAEGAVAGAISRDHELRIFEPGPTRPFPVLSLVGGKWTTYRACAEQIADAVLTRIGKARRGGTGEVPIGGGRGWPQDHAAQSQVIADVSRKSGISPPRAAHLFERYGSRAARYLEGLSGSPETMLREASDYSVQEIAFLTSEERVTRLDDILLRRSTIALLGGASPAAIEEVAAIAGGVLGWTSERTREEIEHVRQQLARRHVVRRI
ncbi:glycerol-3-phosphate dehydrogenase/oxidase [Bradyrhizobium sp. Y36]|uniref:glycerol-3-phosphate dehydrogenase/oxidase n=1 Tax=Bradyrhizobium sp. Y36 TaxID=2035447 RepID=UPI0013042EDF|nr:glycerol-3-phosphate dehydrogenase/oxidase [Bradyrhizobium sp. Y36]